MLKGAPVVVIEAKNTLDQVDQATDEAIRYAEKMNSRGEREVKIAVGAAGEESDGFAVNVRFLTAGGEWRPLLSNGYEITTIPSAREVEAALSADDASTSVEVPSVVEFIDGAIELSRILRMTKVEAMLRPKVIGALTLAMYQGRIDFTDAPLDSINGLIDEAIREFDDLSDKKKKSWRSRCAFWARITTGWGRTSPESSICFAGSTSGPYCKPTPTFSACFTNHSFAMDTTTTRSA